MPIVRFDIKFTEAERALLRKRAKAQGIAESDLLRVCMVADGVLDGDKDALKIAGGRLGAYVREKISLWAPILRGVKAS